MNSPIYIQEFNTSDKLKGKTETYGMKLNWERCKFVSLVSKLKSGKWASNGLMENSVGKKKHMSEIAR